MLNFGEFITEGGFNIPVVSISREKVDLDKDATRNEINRNLSAELSHHWNTPYSGWMKVGRILAMYSITLPKVIFEDDIEGEEIVALSQFGQRWGADLSGEVSQPNDPDEEEYYLYFSYGLADSGFYETYAVVVDEEELNVMLDDDGDKDIDFQDVQGELDPRQP